MPDVLKNIVLHFKTLIIFTALWHMRQEPQLLLPECKATFLGAAVAFIAKGLLPSKIT